MFDLESFETCVPSDGYKWVGASSEVSKWEYRYRPPWNVRQQRGAPPLWMMRVNDENIAASPWSPWLDQFSRGGVVNPFAMDDALFLNFAMLDPQPEKILEFANIYGLLYPGLSQVLPYSEWEFEINTLRFAVEVWQGMRTGTLTSSLEKFFTTDRQGRIELPFADTLCSYQPYFRVRQIRLKPDGTSDEMFIEPNSHLFDTSDSKLEACQNFLAIAVSARLQYANFDVSLCRTKLGRDAMAVETRVTPTSLLSGLWVQFAIAMEFAKQYRCCATCATNFELKSEGATRVYCSDGCRVRAHRARKAKTDVLDVPENLDLQPGDVDPSQDSSKDLW